MICSYLRHIDLIAAYRELEGYNLGYGPEALANIHPAVSQVMAFHLGDRAATTIEHLYGSLQAWPNLHPADIAADVSDYIERDIEALADWCDMPPPTCAELADIEWLEQFQVFAAVAVDKGPADYFELQALLICLYDCACWLYGCGNIDGLMPILARIEEAAAGLAYITARDGAPARLARHAASKKHEKSNRKKTALLTEWDATHNEYKSRADFVRIIGGREKMNLRTLDGWIAGHEKEKRAEF